MDCAMHGILFDHARTARLGMPEAVFCEGKSREALIHLLEQFSGESGRPILFTRLFSPMFQSLPKPLQDGVAYHELSGTAWTGVMEERPGNVAVVSAGTSDGRTAWEAAKTLEYLGIQCTVHEDSGVAGLWRLTSRLDALNEADVIIVVAGLDAALASVMGGLTAKPVIAVPTSVGYGMAKQGEAALNSMLVSCAPGVPVMNIDNGYGAACAAARIVNLLATRAEKP